MSDGRLPRGSPCLSCGKLLDAATIVDKKEAEPKFGDVTICLYCGEIMQFGVGLVLQPLSDETMREVAGDKRVLLAQRARAAVMKKGLR